MIINMYNNAIIIPLSLPTSSPVKLIALFVYLGMKFFTIPLEAITSNSLSDTFFSFFSVDGSLSYFHE